MIYSPNISPTNRVVDNGNFVLTLQFGAHKTIRGTYSVGCLGVMAATRDNSRIPLPFPQISLSTGTLQQLYVNSTARSMPTL